MTKPVLFRITNNLNVGGITTRLRQVLPILTGEYNVHVVTYSKEGILREELQDKGISVHHVPLSGKWSPTGLTALARLLRQHKADIVHTHSFGGNISGILAAAMAKVPVRVGQVHERHLHWYGNTAFRRKKQIFEEYAVHSLFSDAVLFPSQSALSYFSQHCPVARHKLRLLYNGIDLSQVPETPAFGATVRNAELRKQLGIAPHSKVLGFMGRLVASKGVDFALHFMQQIQGEHCLAIVGSSGDATVDAELRRQGEHMGHGRVHFAGLQKNPHPYYSMFDAFFFCSVPWGEALPGTILEAAAHGLPILSRENETVREIATFYDGIRIMNDADAPQNALESLYSMPQADSARIRATFSITAMAANTDALYRSFSKNR